MSPGPQTNCVVIGAGALGLGFLGPELAVDCRVTYLDVPAKAHLIARLGAAGHYVFNESGLSMRPVCVRDVDGLCTGADEGAVRDVLAGADLVFTAVGAANLPKLAPLLAAAAAERSSEGPLRVLCAENGVEIARNLRQSVESEAGAELGNRLLVGDTVMARMCRVEAELSDGTAAIHPVAPGLNWGVVAEPFFGIPVEAHVVAGLRRVPTAVRADPPDRFRAAEDVKMLAHNGLHIALACLGHLRGRELFCELRQDAEALEFGRRLLTEEAVPALLRKHGSVIDRNQLLNYCDSIIRRVTCPVFRDSIARGVRGLMRKLAPTERLVYSVRTVAEQGIEPRAFATGLAAAIRIARQEGETGLSFDEVLAVICGFDVEEEADLLTLIEEQGKQIAWRARQTSSRGPQ